MAESLKHSEFNTSADSSAVVRDGEGAFTEQEN